MLAATIETYGGPFVDQEPVANPETEQAAAQGNLVFRDVAQLTRTGARAWVQFTTSSAAPGVIDASTVKAWTVWGDGDAYKPTVEKLATGKYAVTFASSYLDELGNVEEPNFLFALASHVADPDTIKAPPPQVAYVAFGSAWVVVFDSSFAYSDHSGAYTVVLQIR